MANNTMKARPGLGVGGLPTPVGIERAPAGDGGAGDAGRWQVHRLSGPAEALHHRPWPDPVVASASFLNVDGPALVLGSTQPDSVVDAAAASAAGVSVVRRHSGGGAVLLRPSTVLWVDVLIPTGDPLWRDDVGRAFLWLGEVWVEALAAVGVSGARRHDGPLVTSARSPLVCFAGLGPGEVVVEDGRKVVGISQRRRREGSLFQCAALLAWEPEATAALVATDLPLADLMGVAAAIPADRSALERTFLAALARR